MEYNTIEIALTLAKGRFKKLESWILAGMSFKKPLLSKWPIENNLFSPFCFAG